MLPISSFWETSEFVPMETTKSPLSSAQARQIDVDWTESEWFQVWLRLATRDYQGDPAADNKSPSWMAHAAAA